MPQTAVGGRMRATGLSTGCLAGVDPESALRDTEHMIRRIDNPPNPWNGNLSVDYIGEPPIAELEVFEQRARTILSRNSSPDLPFDYGLNPYRGCFHGCAYCYARPSHQHLGFGAGSDFDRKIVVKVNAPERLRAAFMKSSWRGDSILFSGNTDCYQPLEASYELTRGCLEVCARFRNPVALITKSALIRRDLDVLCDLHSEAAVRVFVSIPVACDDTGRKLEPHASAVSQRFATLRRLAGAGIPCGVAVAPVIPGLTDSDIPEVLDRAADAGASRAFMTLLRLPDATRPVFESRMAELFPERIDKILRALEDMRGGRRNDPRFGHRMRGTGARWRMVAQLFDLHCRRLGLATGSEREPENPTASTFRRPGEQLGLF